ncbi:adherens junction organization [Desmophyllum pertusum]|uniref:Adherens junction organization n=1 Tax=Desmophyllum pertusum TaxID=174260 RepID=A0A9X0A9Y6_9CNID|nr:adherens junction organization [Desmophyllum pertusum]
MRDPTTHVVKEALEKYQMEKEKSYDYCLVMDLEYRGVMRFFFQDAGAKMATKCVRVTSGEKCGGCHKNPGGKISPGYENAFESELLALRGSPARR